ncbi:DUF488 family protein [Rhodopirellula europaea]|uniref:DUF488 domain-containing protein n=1 Tax=Rhodopirellula europaea TaxID=1263866 RepID=UPI003D2658FD
MTTTIYTVGYEGNSIDSFLLLLREHSVDLLVDIRELPISRKRGFAKTLLSQNLGSIGVEYVHMKSLGSPKPARHELRETRDYPKFFSAMDEHLASEKAAHDVNEVLSLAAESRIALMCFCGDWTRCHRSRVAEAIRARGRVSFEHISPDSLSQKTKAA